MIPVDNESNSTFRLLNLLLPPLAGMLVVILVIAFLYWTTLAIIFQLYSSQPRLMADVLSNLGHSTPLAIVIVITVIALLGAGLRIVNCFSPLLKRIEKLQEISQQLPAGTIERAKIWLYYQLRNRIILLVMVSFGITFFLSASLYFMGLHQLLDISRINPEILAEILYQLRYYGMLSFALLILTLIFILLISLRQLQRIIGLDYSTLYQSDPGDIEIVELDLVETEMEKVFLE